DEFETVFSAVPVRERPEWMFSLESGSRARLLINNEIKGETGISQCLPRLVMPNGAVYAIRRKALFGEGVQISKNTGAHVMPFERSIDIDEPIDMEFAEFLIGHAKLSAGK
ncbi:MAG: hypothetical protein PHN63_06035, partial [Candidatus Omnitrophica bacterium]|nr:hypothetical protein [Candidatus Omnitrophota bacterium]